MELDVDLLLKLPKEIQCEIYNNIKDVRVYNKLIQLYNSAIKYNKKDQIERL